MLFNYFMGIKMKEGKQEHIEISESQAIKLRLERGIWCANIYTKLAYICLQRFNSPFLFSFFPFPFFFFFFLWLILIDAYIRTLIDMREMSVRSELTCEEWKHAICSTCTKSKYKHVPFNDIKDVTLIIW